MVGRFVHDKLEKGRYKLTSQRAAVLDIMMDNRGRHLSADEVFFEAKTRLPNIGIATVYRTLEKMASLEILHKTVFDQGKYRYELCDENAHHHHHIICLSCNSIIEVQDDLLNSLEKHLEEQGYRIIDHELKLYAYCPDCLQKRREDSTPDVSS